MPSELYRNFGGRLRPLTLLERKPMLVLSRRKLERIKIGENVWITVLRCGRCGVRLGVDAPPEVPIVREELTPTQKPTHAA